jgi:hypothetical protein
MSDQHRRRKKKTYNTLQSSISTKIKHQIIYCQVHQLTLIKIQAPKNKFELEEKEKPNKFAKEAKLILPKFFLDGIIYTFKETKFLNFK